MLENNPLRQYFRRPSVYLKLPSNGEFYPPNTINLPENGEIPIYPMTAIDEITTKTPDSLYNGVAVVEIIKSCAPNIKDPWQMPIMDLDSVLLAIKAASSNEGLQVNTICPSCSEPSEYEVNVSGILAAIKKPPYDTPLNFGDLKIKFRPLNYKEVNDTNIKQTELQKIIIHSTTLEDEGQKLKESTKIFNQLNELTFDVITNSIDSIEAPNGTVTDKIYIKDFLQNCGRNQFEDIKTKTVNLRESSEIKPLNLTCPNCNHKYQQPFTLNISDFFA